MGRVLGQQEIDAIIKARRAKSDSAPPRNLRACDFNASSQLANDKARAITMLHEDFATRVSHLVGAYLRVPFDTTLISVEQIAFRDFLERQEAFAYVLSFGLEPQNVSGVLQIDHALIFTILDVLLGGTGDTEIAAREITDIEENVLDGMGKMICRELGTAWEPFNVGITSPQRLQSAQTQNFLPLTDRMLVLTFDVQTTANRGALHFALPASIAKLIGRDLANDASHKLKDANASLRLRRSLLQCFSLVTLGIPAIKTSMGELLSLQPGDVLKLHVPVRAPVALMIGGRKVFDAVPVRVGACRAAHLGDRNVFDDDRNVEGRP